MNPKTLMIILFCVVFTVSFVIYLVMVNVIAPHIDLSSTARGNIEVAPELDSLDVNATRPINSIRELQEKAMHELSTYETDVSGMMSEEEASTAATQEGENSQAGTLDMSESGMVNAPGDPVDSLEEDGASEKTSSESTSGVKIELEVPSYDPLPPLDMETPLEKTKQTEKNKPAESIEPAKDNKTVKNPVNRVLVGSYSDITEAKRAYDNMMGSDLDVAPIIKEVEGKYTLQVGAFSDKGKAKDLADKLNKNNYSAVVKSE